MNKDYTKISYEIVPDQFYASNPIYRNKRTNTLYSFHNGKHPHRVMKSVCSICRKPIWKSYHCIGSKSVCDSVFCKTEINRIGNLDTSDGATFISNGYRRIYKHDHYPELNRRKHIAEHRFVMEKKLSRPLQNSEIIHHINFDKLDNREENLLLCNASQHIKSERSLHDIVKNLMNAGVVVFDKKTLTYKIAN